MNDHVIVGDTKEFEGCLVCVCGTLDHAEEVLHRMLTNPTDNDKALMKGHSNFRIAEVPEEYCWWQRGCD